MKAFRHLFLILLCCLSTSSWASEPLDLISERSWLEDPGRRLTFEDVIHLPTTPYEGVLAMGYAHAAVWVRLRVQPALARGPGAAHSPGAEEHNLILRIRPTYLDDVRVFDPLQSTEKPVTVGDRQPRAPGVEPSTSYLLPIPRGKEGRDIWVRLETTSTRMVMFDVMEETPMRLSQLRIEHRGAVYLGVLSMLILWGVVRAALHPTQLFFAFLFYQISNLLCAVFLLGYAQLYWLKWLPPPRIDGLTSLLIASSTWAVLYFGHLLLNQLWRPRWMKLVSLSLVCFYPFLLLLFVLGHARTALHLNMVLIFIAPIIFLTQTFTISRKSESKPPGPDRLPRWMIKIYLSIGLILPVLTSAPALGFTESSSAGLYVSTFYSGVTGFFMVIMLQYREWLTRRWQTDLLISARQSESRVIAERSQREDREKLLAMLGHELKTSLSTLRMLTTSQNIPSLLCGKINSSVNDMTQIVERAIQSSALEGNTFSEKLQNCDLLALVASVVEQLHEGHRIVVHTAGNDLATVRVDPTLMKMIVQNLLDNALKYGDPDHPVTVVITPPNASGHWELLVSNKVGRAGMPDPIHVFRKYYRHPRARYRSGSGLGLFLVCGWSQMMGGDLRYEPTQDCVNFRLLMPPRLKRYAT
jgi:signal transduction histidine kinase